MKCTDIINMSLTNVLRGGQKSLLSVMAIAVGIFSVCLISAMGETAEREVRQRVSETGLGGITIYPSSGKYTINTNQLNDISDLDGVKAVSPFIYQSGSVFLKGGDSQSAAFVGVNEKISDIFNMTLLHGDFFTKQSVSAGERVAVIDDKLAKMLYQRSNIVGKEITFTSQSTKEKFAVIGIIKSQKQGLESMMGAELPNIIYVPHTALENMIGKGQNDKLAVSCMAGADEKSVAEDITRILYFDNNITFGYENINEYISGLWEIVDIIELFIQAVAAIALIVGGIGIMNSMLFTVDARKSDIGVCMALGEKRKSISLRFMTEAIILCLFGGLSGIILTIISVLLIKNIGNINVGIPLLTILKCIGLSALCGCISGIIPANRAAGMNPIDVIRR